MLYQTYKSKILVALQKKMKLKNINAVPRLERVVINVGIGSYILKKDKNYDPIVEGISLISGQKPVIANSKQAVSNFKLRKNVPNGVKVTLRGDMMLFFLDKLINIALPRTRDFRGVSKKSFDGYGNYSIGVKESIIFPEIRIDDLAKVYGLQINIITTTDSDRDAAMLLEEIGIPFKK